MGRIATTSKQSREGRENLKDAARAPEEQSGIKSYIFNYAVRRHTIRLDIMIYVYENRAKQRG